MLIPIGTWRNVVRTTVSPARCSRMAASRWPSNTESMSVYGQNGEVLVVRMP
jgi:hypothetical protein